ncbi:MAG TPA: DUF1800 domain-containing protein [Vicinamibacterales bacterium]|nr:DUF1800 domain-containing protein [Vicinamibacterales bacterium]
MSRRANVVTLSIAVVALAAAGSRPAPLAASENDTSAAAAAHVLNRLAFGPRPGEIASVRRAGINAWIDEQLHPERIDNRALEARLARFETLALDTPTILRDYYAPAMQERRARQKQAGPTNPANLENQENRENPANPPTLAARKARLVLSELSEARVLRAVYSERQLEEVLTDFWFNHFNVFAGKGPTRAFLTSFERDAIRPYVLGDFRQMLEAVAQSPAMLFYLDNWQNVQPQMTQMTQMARMPRGASSGRGQRPTRASGRFELTSAGLQQPDPQRQRTPRGINENYARELLELHTLGVDGGYTQDDVVNVARAFTGWTMRPRQEARFTFARQLHDAGEKHVLGHTLKAGRGVEDGREVLDILVAHPSTAHFIATRLAEKFVSDTPPAALVDRAAKRFRETRGNLREVTRAIVSSPEFLAAEAQRAKVKTPLEFVASALRATGAEVGTALPVIRVLRDLGMPLYFCQPPTGYEERADTWVSSGALVARMNFALELGGGRMRGITVPGVTSASAVGDRLVGDVLAGDVSQPTRATIAKAATADQVIALVIGSPEFQRQ